jgi:hypothetical protein
MRRVVLSAIFPAICFLGRLRFLGEPMQRKTPANRGFDKRGVTVKPADSGLWAVYPQV